MTNQKSVFADLQAMLSAWPIFGGTTPVQAGINSSGDILVSRTLDDVDLNEIWNLLVEGFEQHNQHRTSIADLLSFRTVVPGEAIPQGISSPQMERLTEFGIPTAANAPANALVLGYDFADFGLRASFTWRALRAMTAEQIYATINSIFHSDNRLVTGTVLKRLFDPVARTNAEGFQCRGLYNADGQIPPDYLGLTFDGSATHYWKSGATVVDSGDLDDAIKAIRGKGYGLGNGSQLLILAHPSESEHIQTFRSGVESRPSGPIARHDFIPARTAPAYLQPESIIGEAIEGKYFGVECLGSYGPAWLIESAFIPQGYVAVVASGGPNAQNNVIGLREHPIESYRGLLAVAGNVAGYPLTDSTYIRSFGVGVRQRGAAVAIQVGSGLTYSAPTVAT